MSLLVYRFVIKPNIFCTELGTALLPLVSYEEADCNVCNGYYIQQTQGQDQYILHLPPPPQQVLPLQLQALLQAKLAMISNGISCTSGGACHGQQLLGRTQTLPGQNMIVWVNRNANNVKVMSPIAEPPDNDPLWGGKMCHVVIAHVGNHPVGGHWLTFVKRNNIWWKVDTDVQQPVQDNPFMTQSAQTHTIDILIFSN